MPDLPSGTVTFLLTDIEGSTRLWEQHPEVMRDALARHDALIGAAILQWGGVIVKQQGEGDSLFAVFARATDAVAAASALQQALLAEPWAGETPVRVRLALHTGEAELRGGDYFGPVVNRCARIRAIAHGGQVLLSRATQELVRDALPTEVSLRDLGECRLKDLARPEQLFQLLHPALLADFPPLRSLETFAHNLPVALTSFIGRERELEDVKRLLAGTRLLTLTGSGGCGKTRLALQVAADRLEEYADGIWLVELAPLADPALVPQAVASALGLREEPNRPLANSLTEALRPQRLLLLWDNCEHLLSACAQLAEALLKACPHLRILATSREGLGIGGETTYRVPSLSLPDPKHLPAVESLSQFEAVRLFIDRAVAVVPAFAVTNSSAPAVAQICHRLDGIPLAIELAAARVKVLSVGQIAQRLDDRLHLLTGGSRTALPRHQTLRAAIDWSYDLLSEPERALLRRLAVFSGGWTLEAAEAICGGAEWCEAAEAPPDTRQPSPQALHPGDVLDLLAHLVDRSLVDVEEQNGPPRYRLLETVRQYCRERLMESGESESLKRRHREYFLQWIEEEWEKQADKRLFESELDNFRTALDACESSPEGKEAGLRLAAALRWLWEERGYLVEGRQRLAKALANSPEASSARASALVAASGLEYRRAEYDRARELAEEARAICQKTGDRMGLARSLGALGTALTALGEYDRAKSAHEQALAIFRELGVRIHEAITLYNLGSLAWHQDNLADAHALFEAARPICEEAGHKRLLLFVCHGLGAVATARGDTAGARAFYTQSLALCRETGERYHSIRCLESMARMAVAPGDPRRAARLYGAAEALRRQMDVPLTSKEEELRDRDLAQIRLIMGEEALAAAFGEGLALSCEQAIAVALAGPPKL